MATWVLFRFNFNYGIQKYQPHTTYLVLPSPSDVSTKGELILTEVVLREHVVELVHRQVDYVLHRDWQSQRERLSLVPGESVPAADAARVYAVRRCDGSNRCGCGGY